MDKLTPEAQIRDAIETAEFFIDESLEALTQLDADELPKGYHHRGIEYEEGYHQGRKDALRVLLLSFNGHTYNRTSRDSR